MWVTETAWNAAAAAAVVVVVVVQVRPRRDVHLVVRVPRPAPVLPALADLDQDCPEHQHGEGLEITPPPSKPCCMCVAPGTHAVGVTEEQNLFFRRFVATGPKQGHC